MMTRYYPYAVYLMHTTLTTTTGSLAAGGHPPHANR